jgi:pyrroline-5-carboxylate reductase
LIKHRKIGFIGVGNMGQAIIKALLDSNSVEASRLWATNRSYGKLKKVEELYGVQPLKTNEELIDTCDTIILGVKPQDLTELLEPIASSFNEGHLVISLAAGFTLKSLGKLLPQVKNIVRVMPNTPTIIRKGVIGYCIGNKGDGIEPIVQEILQPLGYVVPVSEGEAFEALTVSCASGTGFILELMQYWQEWIEEHGFDRETARRMVVETFIGTALMAEQAEVSTLSELQEKVTSKKGVTSAGLQSMRELEVERALRYSFEKAVLRDQEISRTSAKS